MGELDFFSLDVKFLLRGEETFRTVFAGIVGMLLYLTTALLTYYIAWPPALTSRITERQLNKYSQKIGHSIFENNDCPISIHVYSTFSTAILPPEFKIRFYEIDRDAGVTYLPFSTDCPYGSQYCLKDKGVSAEIYGGPSNSKPYSKVRVQMIWCNSTYDANCSDITDFKIHIYTKNSWQKKQIELSHYTIDNEVSYISRTAIEYYISATRQ